MIQTKPKYYWILSLYIAFFQNINLNAQTGSWAYDYTYFERGQMMDILDGQILINGQTYSKNQTNNLIIYNLLIDPDNGNLNLAKEIERDSTTLQIDRGLIRHNNLYYNSGGMNSYKIGESNLFQMMLTVFNENLDTVRIIPFRDSILTTFGNDIAMINEKIYFWGLSGVGFSTLFNVLVCMDTMGHVFWHKRYKDDYQFLYSAFIEETHDGQLITTTMGQRYQELKTIVVRKIDTLGNTIWKKDIGINSFDDNSCLARLGSDKYLATTFKDTVYTALNGQLVSYPSHIYILDEKGYITRDTFFWQLPTRRYNKAVSTLDGGALVVGYIILGFSQVAIMTKFDSMGNVEWDKQYRDMDFTRVSGTNEYRFTGGFFDVEVLPDGRIAATGMVTDSASSGANNIWLVVLDSMGCWMPGCEDGLQNTIITHITHEQERLPLRMIPNPARDKVTIFSSLIEYDPVGTIEIFDIQGRLTWHQKGIQPVQDIQLDHLSPGLYIIRLFTKTGYAVERLVIE